MVDTPSKRPTTRDLDATNGRIAPRCSDRCTIDCLRRAISLDPQSPEIHNNLGDVLLKKGELSAALEEYRKGFELAPNDSTFPATHAALLEKLKQPQTASKQ